MAAKFSNISTRGEPVRLRRAVKAPARRLRRDINIRGPLGPAEERARSEAQTLGEPAEEREKGIAGRKEAGRSRRGSARNRPSGTNDPERELGD